MLYQNHFLTPKIDEKHFFRIFFPMDTHIKRQYVQL